MTGDFIDLLRGTRTRLNRLIGVCSPRAVPLGIAVLLGFALDLSLCVHYLAPVLYRKAIWAVALVGLAGPGIVFAYFTITRLLLPRLLLWSRPARVLLVVLSLAISALVLGILWSRPVPLAWGTKGKAAPGQQFSSSTRTAWGASHPIIELHATVDNDPQWSWHTEATLPRMLQQFGGTVHFLVTQPEYVVFDEQGQVQQGADGVDLNFAVRTGAGTVSIQHLTLNLQAQAEERGWHEVNVPVPVGARSLIIEALPGPPGSNNWYDRSWLSVVRIEAAPDWLIRLGDWLLFSALVCLILLGLNRQPQASEAVSPVSITHRFQDALFLGLIFALSTALYIRTLGFYSDDWFLLGSFYTSPDQSIPGLFQLQYTDQNVQRPVEILAWVVLYRLFGLEPTGYHLSGLLVSVTGIVLLYLLLLELGQKRVVALSVALVYGLLPHYSILRYWVAAFTVNLCMTLCLLSFYADQRALRSEGKGLWLWKLLSLFSLLVSTLAYEVALPLFLLSPVLVWFRGRKLYGSLLKHHGRLTSAVLLLSGPVILLLMIVFKARTTIRLGVTTSFTEYFSSIAKQAFATDYGYDDYGLNLRRAFDVNFGDLGLGLPHIIFQILQAYPSAPVLLLSGVCGLFVFYYLYRAAGRSQGELPDETNMLKVAAFGILVFLFGYAIFLTNSNIILWATGITNRTAAAAAVGVALVFTGVAGWVSALLPRAWLRRTTFSLLVALVCLSGFMINNTLASFWTAAYREEQAIGEDIGRQFSSLPAGTSLVLDGVCPYVGPAIVFEANWDLTGLLQIIFRDSTLRANVVSPRVGINKEGLTTTLYGRESVYRFNNLLIYNYERKIVYWVKDAQAAARYFQRYNPDYGRSCPPSLEGIGVPVF